MSRFSDWWQDVQNTNPNLFGDQPESGGTGSGHWGPEDENGNRDWIPDEPAGGGTGGGGTGGVGSPGFSETPEFQQVMQTLLSGTNFQGLDPGTLSGFQNLLTAQGQELGGLSTQTQGLGQTSSEQLGGIFSKLMGVSQGNDPRFAEFQESQFGLMEREQQAVRSTQQEQLARTGLGSSSAALNQLAKTDRQAALDKQALAGELGLTQMSRQDEALLNAANVSATGTGIQSGLIGQQAGLAGQQAELGSLGFQAGVTGTQIGNEATAQNLMAQLAGIEMGFIPETLDIQRLAAQNAGTVTGGGGLTHLCTVLYQHGDMDRRTWVADQNYGSAISRTIYRGYTWWARPLARKMEASPRLYRLLKPIILTWVAGISWRSGYGNRPRFYPAIYIMGRIAEEICRLIGLLVREKDSAYSRA